MPPPTSAPSRPANLARQRCAYHATREAAARCPECKRFYCRECVTEHGDRLLCASCLKKMAAAADVVKPSATFGYIRAVVTVAIGFGVAWSFFAIVLVTLAALPTSWDFSDAWKDADDKPPTPRQGEVEEKGT